jgi:hypothetical protein
VDAAVEAFDCHEAACLATEMGWMWDVELLFCGMQAVSAFLFNQQVIPGGA